MSRRRTDEHAPRAGRRTGAAPVRRLGAVALAAAAALSGCSFRGVDSLPLPGGPDLGAAPAPSRSSSPMCWIWCRSRW
ncbi:hypothetical protein [Actinomadura keratinilytica]|uniref:hypothetical protein n=1 Tax=Actinomadura keratinilytica TaxID=547461 RepID=UPI0036089290